MDPLFIKICGITTADDAFCAHESGANAVGFNFFPQSKRFISPEDAAAISEQLPVSIMRVGVFVNPKREYVNDICRLVRLNGVQFSGDESPEEAFGYQLPVFKAIHVKDENSIALMKSYTVDAFLLDTHRDRQFGGTGKIFDWAIGLKAKQFGKIILAGGLTPENVADAVRTVAPYGLDVSSGVETRPGVKDHKKIKEFILRARDVSLAKHN